jgi:hypothetical protein
MLAVILCLALSACLSGSTATYVMPIRSSIVQSGVRLALTVRGGRIDPHHVDVVVRVANESRHRINVYSYPVSCAVPEGNPTVFVLDAHGKVLNPPTFSGASCPYPGARALAPHQALQRTVSVDLRDRWLQGVVILASVTGLQRTIETKRVHVVYAGTL